MKVLVVVDVQNDFITGALGTDAAQVALPTIRKRMEAFLQEEKEEQKLVVFTQDTHDADYLQTQEGHMLPVVHCVRGSEGWKIPDEIRRLSSDSPVFEKPTFGSETLAEYLQQVNQADPITSIELLGFCTDICVISNALLLKAALPEVPISVTADCCAGVTPDSHEAALRVMQSCQIEVKNS